MLRLSNPVKISLVGASVSFILIMAVASYFRRRKKRRPYRDISPQSHVTQNSHAGSHIERPKSRSFGRRSGSSLQSPNGEMPGHRSSLSSSIHCQFNNSTASVSTIGSLSSVNTLTFSHNVDPSTMTSEQLCELGMESMKQSIEYWELAADHLAEREDVTDGTMDHLSQHIRQLIDRARRVQELYEEKIFSTVSTNVAMDSAIITLAEMNQAYSERRASITSLADSSDMESFVSATDMADLSDLEDHIEHYQHLALYEAALLELEHGSIPFRTLRTTMVKCNSDTEFLAKLHCIRIALEDLFKDKTIRDWFAESSKQMLSDLLIKAERDPEEYEVAFEEMIEFIGQPDNWATMEEELRGRGVKVLSFYDIVIDFILFDAFDDLENPPSSVTTVVQNRWLSNGFKETALTTAVWSVLKAKRRMLKVPRGFIAHFYSISEHVSPVLAWGFLGPDSDLKNLCRFFKEQILLFMQDVFSFTQVRYTTVEHLSDDILRLCKDRLAIISENLAS